MSFVSCINRTSGFARSSHHTTFSSRAFNELTFQVAMRIVLGPRWIVYRVPQIDRDEIRPVSAREPAAVGRPVVDQRRGRHPRYSAVAGRGSQGRARALSWEGRSAVSCGPEWRREAADRAWPDSATRSRERMKEARMN